MGHHTSHDYARDIVKDYFRSVTSSVADEWRLYEKLCCAHMSMRGMQNQTYKIDF